MAGRPDAPSAVRVLHLLKHAQRGNGSVHVAVDLACAQADEGHEVWFAAARGSYDEVLRRHGVMVVEMPEPSARIGAARAWSATAGLIRRVRPDIAHTHMMSSTVLAWVPALVYGTAIVATMHNSFDRHSWLMRLGRVVVAVSRAEAELLVDRGFPRRRVRVVVNGVIGSAREDIETDEIGDIEGPCLVTVSGLHGRKGVDDVIRAFALAAVPGWHLNVIGWGPARADLEDLAAELGVADAVHFCGPTLTPWRQLAQAQIFVTGAHAEPFGLNVIEARAAGCAVVATDVGGIPEALDGAAAGLLVPPRNPRAMAAALRTLMSDDEALARWRRRAPEGIERFHVSRMARDYTEVYREALGRRRRSHHAPGTPASHHPGAVPASRRSTHQH